jgi:hypothetical protein
MRDFTDMRIRTFSKLVALVAAFGITHTAQATPLTLHLKKPASSIKFGVSSPTPTLQMNGSLSDYAGLVVIDPQRSTLSHVKLSLDLSSAQLPPNQFMQAILLQTLLAKMQNGRTTFESSDITHLRGSQYLVSGTYTWMNSQKQAEVPIQLVQATPTKTEIRIIVDEPIKPSSKTSQFGDVSGSSGWAKATLIFAGKEG